MHKLYSKMRAEIVCSGFEPGMAGWKTQIKARNNCSILYEVTFSLQVIRPDGFLPSRVIKLRLRSN